MSAVSDTLLVVRYTAVIIAPYSDHAMKWHQQRFPRVSGRLRGGKTEPKGTPANRAMHDVAQLAKTD
jgi:hypothetical protein